MMKGNIELIRFIAVVLITFTHTRNNLTSDDGWLYILIEQVPRVGTLLLSVVSGYLFVQKSQERTTIITRKAKSLILPYFIANISVLLLTLFANFVLKIDVLNRLSFDARLITEGVLSLHEPPINPPTYFVRDIFIIFSLIEVLYYRHWFPLLWLVPLAIFGQLLLRYDILILFIIGCLLGLYETKIRQFAWVGGIALIAVVCASIWLFPFNVWRYPLAIAIFIPLMYCPIAFPNMGGFAYLLHLYHAPTIVVTAPILARYISYEPLWIGAQIMVALIVAVLLWAVCQIMPRLKIISGGR